MISWCCYCQRLIGEVEPLDDFALSHGVCAACELRLAARENLKDVHQHTFDFFARVFREARVGDRATCSEIVRSGLARGYSPTDLLLGLIQPALWAIGKAWEVREASVADEHRFTEWCRTVFALLPPPPPEPEHVELLIFQAPGNRHELGPLLAERVLSEAGIGCRAFVPDLSADELLALTRKHTPRWVGFSCALPQDVEPTRALIASLRAGGYLGQVMISGQAIRRGGSEWGPGVIVCRTVDEARAVITAGR